MLGFDENKQTLMVALYKSIDSFGTACSVTGDGAISVIMDKIVDVREKRKLKSQQKVA